MILPPVIIDVKVRERDGSHFRLWLPFFVLWPLVFVIVLLALIVSILADVFLMIAGNRYHHYTALLFAVGAAIAEVRGTKAYVSSEDSLVDVVIV